MKRSFDKIASAVLILIFVVMPVGGPGTAEAQTSRLTVASAWTPGTDEYWHLRPVDEKTAFRSGQPVQFFAQYGPVYRNHQWRLILYRDNTQVRTVTNAEYHPGIYGWNYSNFIPVMYDLGAGQYRAEYYLDLGQGFNQLGSVSFSIQGGSADYTLNRAVAATGWRYGTGSDYWNIQPVNPKSVFNQGDTAYLVVQTRNIGVSHRYKAELYRYGSKLWENVSLYQTAATTGNYSNYYINQSNLEPGQYEFRVYIDTGSGFQSLATVPFTVNGSSYPVCSYPGCNYPYYGNGYTYDRATVATGWRHGSGVNYWNLRPVGAKTSFSAGETVHAVAMAHHVYVNHQWKSELYRNGSLYWENVSPWRFVGRGWLFSAYYPSIELNQSGNYEWKIYLNSGSGFRLLDTKPFRVTNGPERYDYAGATVAEGLRYGTGSDYWNVQPSNPRTSFPRGMPVYLVAQARNVKTDHRWRVEIYRSGSLVWEYSTDWNRVGRGWTYSNFDPVYYNSTAGSYQFKLYWDSGYGFNLIDTKDFSVY